MMADTPGPWEIGETETRVSIKSGNRTIAYVQIARNDFENANLIVAAPDLLAALKELLPEGWGDDDTMDHIPGVKRARAAIAKAEAGDDCDDWTIRDEAAWEREEELRHEYAEDEYDARRARNAHRCQCAGYARLLPRSAKLSAG